MFKAFKGTIGAMLGVIFVCVVITFVILGAAGDTDTSKTTESKNDQSELAYQSIYESEGNGKNSTERFDLIGNDTQITFSFSGNEDCYDTIGCSPTNASLNLECDESLFSDLILNDIISELDKTYNVKDQKGECFLEVDVKEGVAWNIEVQEKR